jgi:ABC-type transport system involved in multi-copper enzyme maturation permease subunit
MTFLPIVDRELRAAARRHATYTMRLAVGLIAILISILLYMANVRSPNAVMARHIFEGLAVVGLLYCLAAGRRFTADCVSEEKREGTLGLLFLTQLNGYDVVLGKLAATSLNGLLCLLAIFPVMAIPLLMGGITNAELWRLILVLIDTFLFSLAIGMFASVLSWNPRHAMGANFLWWLLLAGALPTCAGIMAYLSPGHSYFPELLYSCPGYAFYLAFETNYKWHGGHFWWSLGIVLAISYFIVAYRFLFRRDAEAS